MDHVVPLSKGGKWVWENLVTACSKCNGKKGSKSLKQLGWTLKQRPQGALRSLAAQFIHPFLLHGCDTSQVTQRCRHSCAHTLEAKKYLRTLQQCRSLHPTRWEFF